MDELGRLAEFVVDLDFDDLPAAVVDRARLVLADTVGVIIAGMREAEVRALADHAAALFPGPAQLFGHPGRSTPAWSVLVHGTAGTTLEMDEGHAHARGHAAIHAVPVAIALAQANRLDGRETLTALIAGYEVAARAGVGTRLRKPVHPFGTWGVLGSAAIAARVGGLGAEGLAGVLEVAASYAIAASFETAYQGANVRNTYAGLVNKLGLLAAELYPLGIRGEPGGLETAFGQILGDSFDPAALIDGLGERFEIMRGYFKPYSGCRYTHAAIDAVLNLREDAEILIEEIESVEVATYDIAAHLSNPAPQTPLAGRFSTPFVVAATLIHGSAGPEIFEPEVLRNPGVLDLSARVTVREEPSFTAMTPARRPAKVTLRFNDGSERERTVTSSKGDPDQPMSADEIRDKFQSLVAPTLGAERAGVLWEQIGQFDTLSDVSGLAESLKP